MNATPFAAMTADEQATAVLHLNFWGHAPWLDSKAEWVLDRLKQAALQAVHLNAVRREFRARFVQRHDPDRAIASLLDFGPADVYLSWQRADGSLVFYGASPSTPTLPVGLDPWRPGFQMDEWLYNARPEGPVRA